ncbi:DUF551 domain-containing protein [Cronobacter turicensis]|nr:DUF551 domain-containing protein [Cronobacter turicensis]
MEWVKCSESLPEANKQVLVNDVNGEGVLIAWRSLWMSNGKPTGEWEWVFQIQDIDSDDVKIKEWCSYPEPLIK